MKLEDSSLGECQRPDIHEQRLSFTKSDHQTLLYYLNNKNVIDSVNDNLLSRFIFSIREHTNVVHCSLDCEKRVRQLIDTMKKCAEKIFKDFCEILNSIEMSHVIGKLEKRSQGAVTCRQRQKRKPSSTQGRKTLLLLINIFLLLGDFHLVFSVPLGEMNSHRNLIF